MRKTTYNKKSKINSIHMIFVLIVVLFIFIMLLIQDGELIGVAVEDSDYNQISYIETFAGDLLIEGTTAPVEEEPIIANGAWYPFETERTSYYLPDFDTKNILLIDGETAEILYADYHQEVVYPASLTKVMTLIVAVENIDNLDDRITITHDMLEPLYAASASLAGFQTNESVSMRDLLFGCILPSGADATTALATYIAGTEAEFAKLMNEKADELGLKNTNFVNASGLHDANHYTTAEDMAVILKYAMEDNLCREVLSTVQYTTEETAQSPNGIVLHSSMFSKMYGTETDNVTIHGGKTGFTDQARHCLASFAVKDGKEYILVQMGGIDNYDVIFEALDLYDLLNN